MTVYTVIVDSREYEKASEVVAWLKRYGCAIAVRQLDAGDYVVSERVAVERKRAMDFISSIVDGRIFEQAKRLVERYKSSYVIVEGNLWRAVERRSVHPHSIIGVMIGLTREGVHVVFTRDCESTAYAIYSIAKQTSGETARTRSSHHVVRKDLSIRDLQIQLLTSLPGIGVRRAERILQAFESPLNALNNISLWPRKADVPEIVVAAVRKVLTTRYLESKKEKIMSIEEVLRSADEGQESSNLESSNGILKFVKE